MPPALGASALTLGPGASLPPNVDVSRARGPPSEVAIAVDPRHDRILVAGSISLRERTMRAYSSTDGGATWTSVQGPPLPRGLRITSTGDPAVGVDRTGRQYYAFLAARLLGPARSSVFVAARTGPTAPWTTPRTPIFTAGDGQFDDRPALAVDVAASSPHANRVYLVWTMGSRTAFPIVVSHSDDGGKSWSSPTTVARERFDSYAGVAIGPNGDVYLAWENGVQISIARSTDGGEHFGEPRRVAQIVPSAFACGPSGVRIAAQPQRCVRPNPGRLGGSFG